MIDPELKLFIKEEVDILRKEIKDLYAIKLVQTIVFAGLAIVASAVVYKILGSIGL